MGNIRRNDNKAPICVLAEVRRKADQPFGLSRVAGKSSVKFRSQSVRGVCMDGEVKARRRERSEQQARRQSRLYYPYTRPIAKMI